MLNRIKIRGKLLLLLVTPLLAVLLFAFSGVMDRTDAADASAREARIAEFADTTADLSTNLQVESFQTLLSDRLMTDGVLRPDIIATDEALVAWTEGAAQILGDLTSPELREGIQSLSVRMSDTVSADRAERFTPEGLANELRRNAAGLNEVALALENEATSVELFRTLDVAGDLIAVQNGLARIGILGDGAIDDGDVRAALPLQLTATVQAMTVAYDAAHSALGPSASAELDQLLDDGLLPHMDRTTTGNTAGFDPVDEIRAAIDAGPIVGSEAWTEANADRLTALNEVLDRQIADTAEAAAGAADAADEEASQFLILAISVVVLALFMAVLIGRSVSRPLIRLTNTAKRLSSEELPAMVESMRTAGRTPAPTMTPIRAKGRDEVAQLGRAFSEIQAVTVEVAEEQGNLLRRGISDIFVNLARRNQSLLDRQIDFIDELENHEENPDQLENLFRLDHLATRMRRNAESLLVLAGAEPPRRRGRPVELGDVVRVAMGEIEDFARIHSNAVDPATVAGSVAVDLAHLLSELMENATQFSPPETEVDVVGQRSNDGSYQLTVTDRGIGMSAEQLAAANDTLTRPPIIGLDLSRSLGFTVVSRLAHRLGVTVRLTSPSEGGVSARVDIPAEMIGDVERPTPPVLPATGSTPAPSAAAEPTARPTLTTVPPPPPAPPVRRTEPDTPRPVGPTVSADTEGLAALPTRTSTPPSALPKRSAPAAASGDLFDVVAPADRPPAPPDDREADLFAPLTEAPGPPPATGAPTPPSALPQRQRPSAAEPAPTTSSAPPLPTRRPRTEAAAPPPPPSAPAASEEPGLADRALPKRSRGGLLRRTRHDDAPADDGRGVPDTLPAMTAGHRSPEEVRQLLSRYRDGQRKGRSSGGNPSSPDAS